MSTAAQSSIKVWIKAARPKTLGAAIAPILIGTAMAWEAGAFHAPSALLALIGGVLIQVGVNYHNDYVDYLKERDTEERVGPTRVTQAGFVKPETMRRATIAVFGLAVLAGVYLIVRGGWPILAIGVASIGAAIWYTAGPYPLSDTGLADLAVLIFFGPVAVGGTYYVQALTIEPVVLVAGLAPGLLSVAILLVNNIRDLENDRAAGKKTLPVRFGRGVGVGLYATCIIGSLAVPPALYVWTGARPWALAALVVLPMAMPIIRRLSTERDPERLNPLLGATGRVLVVYSVLFAIGWNL